MLNLKKTALTGILTWAFCVPAPLLQAQSLTDGDTANIMALKKTALQSNLAYEIDESLTTEVGPRLVGTPGDAQGITWAVAKMKQLGFDKVWTEEVQHVTWTRGVAEARIIAPYPQKMVAIALGGSTGTPADGLKAEVVEFKDFAALEAAPEGSLEGKIAYVSFRMERKINGAGYGPAVKARGAGPSMAASKGAVAYVMRSVGTDNNRLGHTGGTNYKDGITRIPAAALSNPDADLLSRAISRGKPVEIFLKLTAERKDDVPVITANVIGEITGSEKPEEIVVMAAHLDSWDVGTGAVDDGIGVSVTLAAAHHIANLPERPKRTIRVILFAAEEVGLVGVKHYMKDHENEIAQHVIGAEWDFGVGLIYEMVPGVGPAALNQIRELAHLLAPLGVSLSPKNDAKGQSDLSLLGKAGMPAVNFSPDGMKYFDYHHTDNDTLDKVDPEALKQNTAVFTIFSYFAAQSGIDFRK
ncbi:M20/M25/M40 family metallo-hydrolase [Paremcibacter congregatus]|uniref:M20/M25/M40 family metallo-hydrolase n=1 Tax=Paremcibacter congregatus TaxID=2043170 RepID=UPI0030ED34FA|tara:strand:+ start:4446 stop:5855 length:1410 start_codon:yes stop_codon:yes gene_type:complete